MSRLHFTFRLVVVLVGALFGFVALAVLTGPLRTLHDAQDDLVSAIGTQRLLEGRLTGGFAYGSLSDVRRGRTESARLDSAVPIAVARLRRALERHRSPDSLQAFAAGQLLLGNADEAVQALTEVLRLEPERASAWSDLAAAQLARAGYHPERSGQALVEGFNAAIKAAQLEPSAAEALFNLALLTERLVPPAGGRAWQAYLRVDPASAWADEARTRMVRLAETETARLHQVEPLVGDSAAVGEIVLRSPQQGRKWAEEELLPRWADAWHSGRHREAEETLATLVTLAHGMREVTGDSLLADAVAAIRRSDSNARERLSEGHLAYRDARRHYQADRLADADRAFTRAALALRDSTPFVLWADLYLAIVRFDTRHIATAEAAANRVLGAAEDAGYTVLIGRSNWIMGLCQHQRNAIDDALVSYRSAVAAFARAGERESELAVMNSAAENLRLRGDQGQSWEYLSKVLEGSDSILSPRRRYLLFLNAALFAAEQDLNEAALAFYDAAIEAAPTVNSAGPRAEGLLYRARLLHLMGRIDRAQSDVAEARQILSGGLQRDPYLAAEIAATQAELLASTDANAAAREFNHAIGFFEVAEPARIPRLLLLRGRMHVAAGRYAQAVSDFDSGIQRFESRRGPIGDTSLRISYADESRDLFNERIVSCVREYQNPDCAFSFAERASARTLLDSRGLRPLSTSADAVSALPAGASILRLWVGRERVFVWAISKQGARFEAVHFDSERLSRLVETFRNGVIAGRRDDEAVAAGGELYAHLVKPFISDLPRDSTLAIVPDGALSVLPFAALEENGRPLIERIAIVEAPSATLLLERKAITAPDPDSAPLTALLVGNPTLDARVFSTLPPLPYSEREVREISAVYDRPTILLGAQATRARFLRDASSHTVVHFAGHAVANELYPMFSLLALGADGIHASGALFAQDIAGMNLLRTRLVVLAACDTAGGRISKGGEGVLSLARPFLAAGVPTVVASLWPIEDRATAELMSRVHRRYAATRDAVRALRLAQLDMINSGDPELRQPRSWAGFVVIGTVNGIAPFTKEKS